MLRWKSACRRIPLDARGGSRRTSFLGRLSGEFDQLCAGTGRRSIATDNILWALLLQELFDPFGAALGRAGRLQPAICWFGGLGMDDTVWARCFRRIGDRLLSSAVAQGFFSEVYRGMAVLRMKSYGKKSKMSCPGPFLGGKPERLIAAAMVTHRPTDMPDATPHLMLHEQQRHL
jgi:hypothetical protein